MALESPFVSAKLNQWVDLIFGNKQRGQAAIDAGNDFHPYSYPEIMDTPEAAEMKPVFTSHALNFGVVPAQLFKKKPSPQRGYSPVPLKFTMSASSLPLIDASLSMTIGGTLCLLRKDTNSFDFYKLDRTDKPLRITLFNEKFSRNFNQKHFSKHIRPFANEKLCAVSSQWTQHFTLFNVGESEAKVIFDSHRHGGYVSAIDCDIARTKDEVIIAAVSGSKDSSCFFHLLKYTSSHEVIEQQFIPTVNKAPIIDVSVCIQIDLVATVDESNHLVYRSLTTGSIIHTKQLDKPPSSVLILPSGYTMVITDSTDDGKAMSEMTVFDMMCEQVNKCVCSKVSVMERMTFGFNDFVICAFEDKTIDVLDGFSLAVICHFSIDEIVTSICYILEEKKIVFSVESGNVWFIPLAY